MDNVCHTLVGIAASRAGLKTTTRFATATLAIAANLPDIDVLAFATSIPSVAIRRGWTHGVLAQALLPVAFAGVMWAIGRRLPHSPSPIPRFGALLVLSYIGVLSHVFLDYLNTYGVRLLMPFSGHWFYGDSVFIVDIWLWLMLGIGTVLARGHRTWPAKAGLAVAAVYILGMLASGDSARSIVEQRWSEATGSPPRALMVGPVPVNPFRKNIIADAGDRYVTGKFSWYPRQIAFDRVDILKNDRGPWVKLAMSQEPDFAAILIWARFPFWLVEEDAQGMRVTLRDARFPQGIRGFSATTYIRRGPVQTRNSRRRDTTSMQP